MTTYTLSSRNLSLDDSWDVIVLGGGPAGCAAAASAAREGARTLLIESTGCLGGMGTSALVPAWCPFSDREKIIYRGLAERVLTECKAGMPHVAPEMLDWVPIDSERLKRVYDDLVTGHGAQVLFQTLLCAVDRDASDRVTAVVTASKSGLTAYQARVFVDATGDADLCAWAGAGFDKGEVKDLMPATHCFVLTNVDEPAFRQGPYLHPMNPKSPIYAIVQSGRYPEIPDTHLCCNLIGPGTVGFNAGHLWNVDNTEPATVSRALIEGRRMAHAYRNALAEFYPEAFGNAFLVNTGSLMGVRETRRIIGDYRLTLKDYLARRSFPDEICRNAYFLDVHPSVTDAVRDIEGQDGWEKRSLRYLPGEAHGIPYGCLVPKDVTNVLAAGRSISCEQVVQGSIRVMPVCLAMGEAAGLAAALAAQNHDGSVRAIDVGVLRARLREEGAYLP